MTFHLVTILSNPSNTAAPSAVRILSDSLVDYFLGKNYFLEESDYLNGKLPDRISFYTGTGSKKYM